MSLKHISIRTIAAVALISFFPYLFQVFDWTFASCYIDDGCGNIDPFVPLIVIFVAVLASTLTGLAASLIFKAICRP